MELVVCLASEDLEQLRMQVHLKIWKFLLFHIL